MPLAEGHLRKFTPVPIFIVVVTGVAPSGDTNLDGSIGRWTMLHTDPGDVGNRGDVEARIIGGEMHICIGGDFSISLAPEVRQIIRQGLDAGVPKIIIDMRKVDYIDSSGIGTLVMAMKGIQRTGGKLEVLGVPEQAKKLLKFPPFCEDDVLKTEIFGE